jgi:hypothetical protein
MVPGRRETYCIFDATKKGDIFQKEGVAPMKKTIVLCCLFLLTLFTIANADTTFTSNTALQEALPDECFAGTGIDYPNGISGYNPLAGPPCPATLADGVTPVVEKYNQTYLWGLTKLGASIWMGTGANIYCTTANAYLDYTDPEISSRSICEYGQSMVYRKGIVADEGRGDWRPPKIYEYVLGADGISGTLIDRTPSSDPLLKQVMGIRAAGSFNGVVFMAGGARTGSGIIMFAWDANTKEYLGSYRFTQWGTSPGMTIRKFLVVNNRLYTGVGSDQTFGYGYVLRWTGSRSNPFSFLNVGRILGTPRELAEYTDGNGQTRIAATAQGVYLSPAITSPQGLTYLQSLSWSMVWTPWSYEPDTYTAISYGGGAIYQFDGWLYWGTNHIPYRGGYLHENCPYSFIPCFGMPADDNETNILLNGTWRATTLWRGRNLESANPEIQLLYGESELPAFDPATRTFPMTSTGWTPLYGHSGYEDPAESIAPNIYNEYTWTMKVANGKLFLGTFDVGGSADLWRIDDSSSPAKREDGNGVGDRNNYGIRTIEASDDGTILYLGMASNVNLVGTPSSTRFAPGWELRALNFAPLAP